MDLKNFISESLCQIVGGIRDAQERIAELKYELEKGFLGIEGEKESHYQDVYFDVALTVIEEETEISPKKLLVMGLSHVANIQYEHVLSLVSRVKFSVPLSYVMNPKDKPFSYLRFNAH